jgi:adenylylsulfate kinase
MGCRSFVFDGDNVRHGLCADLSFSEEDRKENIRRIGEMTKLFMEAGVIAMTAFISPFRADRRRVRDLMPEGDFVEVYCRCGLETCEKRDVKGLYAKARAGLIQNYTGISSPYEEPEKAEVVVDTDTLSLEESVEVVLSYLHQQGYISNLVTNTDATASG